MSTDKKGTRILARTFFHQLRASGYTQHQIIGIATELLDLVAVEVRESAAGVTPVNTATPPSPAADWRQAL